MLVAFVWQFLKSCRDKPAVFDITGHFRLANTVAEAIVAVIVDVAAVDVV